jgi:hypothetical protein
MKRTTGKLTMPDYLVLRHSGISIFFNKVKIFFLQKLRQVIHLKYMFLSNSARRKFLKWEKLEYVSVVFLLNGIVSRDFVVCFWLVSFDRSELPAHTERVC